MIEIVTINEAEKWDKIVKEFVNYDVQYLNNYAKAFQIHEGGDPFLVYYHDGDTKAINVVIKN